MSERDGVCTYNKPPEKESMITEVTKCPNCDGCGYDPDEVLSEDQLSAEECCPVCMGMGRLNA